MKRHFISKIIEREMLLPDILRLVLSVPTGFTARPGQFINMKPVRNSYPLLRRPISISLMKPEGMELLIKIIGQGTQQIEMLHLGEEIDVLAPLGNGFELEQISLDTRIALVGGGIGTAPLRDLVTDLKRRGFHQVTTYVGFRDQAYGLAPFQIYPLHTVIEKTDGFFVTDLLKEQLEAGQIDLILACGPHGMLQVISDLSRHYDVPAQISMEEKMACGIGACLGCTIKVKRGDFDDHYLRVCKEGPVFMAREVIWHED